MKSFAVFRALGVVALLGWLLLLDELEGFLRDVADRLLRWRRQGDITLA